MQKESNKMFANFCQMKLKEDAEKIEDKNPMKAFQQPLDNDFDASHNKVKAQAKPKEPQNVTNNFFH